MNHRDLKISSQQKHAEPGKKGRASSVPAPAPRKQLSQVPVVQRKEACACGGGCPRCGQAQAGDAQKSQLAPQAAELLNQAGNSHGSPLPAELREQLSSSLDSDLENVRVHTGESSARAAEEIGARAYTTGRDIHFAQGAYNPSTTEGKRLLAHEAVHTLQQGLGQTTRQHKTEVSQPSDPAEREADTLADAIITTGAATHPPRVHATPHIARQTPAGGGTAATAATDTTNAAAAAAAPPEKTWEDLLPHVHSADATKKRDPDVVSVVHEKEKAPTLKYNEGKYKVEAMPGEPAPMTREKDAEEDYRDAGSAGRGWAWAAAKEEDRKKREELAAKRYKAVTDIIAARNAIPARDITRSPFSKDKVGNFYDPSIAAGKGDKEAADYNAWMGGAKPTSKFDEKNADDKKKWEIFKKLFILEGRIGTITTSDKTLTIGVGFSSAGTQVEQVIAKLFTALPEVKKVAFAAGLTMKGNDTLVVVDTDKSWILEGFAAAAYVQTNTALLSLFINASQGTQPDIAGKKPDAKAVESQRQAMVNAQWEVYLSHAVAGIPGEILGWPLDSVALAVHSRHAIQNTFPWSFWQAHNDTDLRKMVRAIYHQLRDNNQLGWLFPICNGETYTPHAKAVKEEEEAKGAAKSTP
jgi:hypothetical protein